MRWKSASTYLFEKDLLFSYNKGMKLFSLFIAVLFLCCHPVLAHAAGMITIRDTEIENQIKMWATPVIQAAGLAPSAVKIVLVQSPDVNAFVSGGQNIYIYTGLIEKTETPDELLGVIAHELGHIAGGHLARAEEEMENTSTEMILGAVLGAGVAVATGSPDAAAAITSGTATYAQRKILSFSRTQESSADQAALKFLKRAGVSGQGLVHFMQKLETEEQSVSSIQSQYMRTHPLSRDRVDALKSALDRIGNGQDTPDHWVQGFKRVKAKLIGYTSPAQVEWIYAQQDQSIPARYARAIAAYRQNQVETALSLADGLIASEPKNPYFHELKGQMLYDFGRVDAAAGSYARALMYMGERTAPLIQIAYAQALGQQKSVTTADRDEAISLLENARIKEPRYAPLYRLLAILYGQSRQEGSAQAMLAEEAAVQGRRDEAKRLAERALVLLSPSSPHGQQMKDLLTVLANKKKK
jgi:predicted Zn-dependent protease